MCTHESLRIFKQGRQARYCAGIDCKTLPTTQRAVCFGGDEYCPSCYAKELGVSKKTERSWNYDEPRPVIAV